MERRKFVVGLGSLAAGGAAAMGTGALSQSSVDRSITGRVANDDNAYLGLDPAVQEEYAEIAGDGELVLNFGNNDVGGGLNPDSENWFDGVFRINNNSDNVNGSNSGNTYQTYIEKNGPNKDRFDFYADGGKALGTLTTSNKADIDPGDSVLVGVHIDLSDSGLASGDSINSLFQSEDTFTIIADDAGN